VALALGASSATSAQEHLAFRAQSPQYADAARHYERIWREDGARIACLLEAETGLVLAQREIDVIVFEGVSHSGSGTRPMRLRASYQPAVKRGMLVHELAHRYLDALRLPRGSLSVHQQLDLLLLRVWPRLWGEAFIAPQVRAESQWTRDYRHAWEWALRLSVEQRDEQWRALLASRRAPAEARPRTADCDDS
jgi:hypothetical protein